LDIYQLDEQGVSRKILPVRFDRQPPRLVKATDRHPAAPEYGASQAAS